MGVGGGGGGEGSVRIANANAIGQLYTDYPPYQTLNDVNIINVHVVKQEGSGTSLCKD